MIKKIPYLLAMLSMFGGVLIAIVFGVNEDFFKNQIAAGLEKNVKIQSLTDPSVKEAKLASEADKNWRYYQRFHFHATGIGAMMLSLLLFLGKLKAPKTYTQVTSYLISIGGFLYPFVWLFAAIYGPEMGRTEAKEAFAIFGYMGGLFLVGCLAAIALTIKSEIET